MTDWRQAGPTPSDLESDEEVELALRGELAEMVRASGVSDANVLLDIDWWAESPSRAAAVIGTSVHGFSASLPRLLTANLA